MVGFIVTLYLANLMTVKISAIQEDEATRKLWDTGFLKKRPASTAPKKSSAAQPQPKYRRVTPRINATDRAEDAVVGITVWRLRPSKAADEARILLYKKDSRQADEWTPERIESDTPLAKGQRLRLSIEAPRTGFLYVIDREQYADGSLSEPYLIFPILSSRNGENAVTAGRVIEIPPQDDDRSYSYFELEPLPRSNQPEQVGEMLTVIVAPEKLSSLKIGREPLLLSKEQVAAWEKRWGAQVERIEMVDGAGKAYTAAEKAAGANPAQRLTSDDPLPQTIFRVAAKQGDPLMVNVTLRIGK
jgi:hypothetical protein